MQYHTQHTKATMSAITTNGLKISIDTCIHGVVDWVNLTTAISNPFDRGRSSRKVCVGVGVGGGVMVCVLELVSDRDNVVVAKVLCVTVADVVDDLAIDSDRVLMMDGDITVSVPSVVFDLLSDTLVELDSVLVHVRDPVMVTVSERISVSSYEEEKLCDGDCDGVDVDAAVSSALPVACDSVVEEESDSSGESVLLDDPDLTSLSLGLAESIVVAVGDIDVAFDADGESDQDSDIVADGDRVNDRVGTPLVDGVDVMVGTDVALVVPLPVTCNVAVEDGDTV